MSFNSNESNPERAEGGNMNCRVLKDIPWVIIIIMILIVKGSMEFIKNSCAEQRVGSINVSASVKSKVQSKVSINRVHRNVQPIPTER